MDVGTGEIRSSQARTASPTMAVTTAGSASSGPAAGWISAAAPAAATSATSRTAPRTNFRRASSPATPASRRVPSSTLPMRTGLSLVPSSRTAHTFRGVGVRLMTAVPTASTGEEAGTVSAATRCPTAVPARAARMPATKGRSLRWGAMTVIRHDGCPGWVFHGHVASYTVNPDAVAKAERLIRNRQYVLDSDWGEVQPGADEQNAYLENHSWEEYAAWHLGLTEGANDETKARHAFVYGDLRRVHRTALIACVYRASEWRHKEVELAAHDLLQLLDRTSG